MEFLKMHVSVLNRSCSGDQSAIVDMNNYLHVIAGTFGIINEILYNYNVIKIFRFY